MHNKNRNYGFVIISPDHNAGLVKSTIFSIKRECDKNIPYICIVGDDTKKEVVTRISEDCPTYVGGGSITSLINKGLRETNTDWNIIVFEGSQVEARAVNKLFYFADDDNTILYPIVINHDRQEKPLHIRADFDVATINGLTMRKETFRIVGDFTENALIDSKMHWQMEALQKGYKFKAILGAKML